MGIYTRWGESPYWWLYFPPTKHREPTTIPVGVTAAQKKDSRALALELYHTGMLAFGRTTHQLAEPPVAPAPVPTFDAFADWYEAHHISQDAGAERERDMLERLTGV